MERKLATVLFVDLVSSTDFVAGADPEVVRRRVDRFFEHVSSCIESHGGTVEKFAGDAVMAAFGIPLAHEDDAERAVRAALAILADVRALGLEARVGIESGEVVATPAESTFATGEAVNLAARLQQAAASGEVLTGPGAHRLTRDAIETEPVGPLELRGWPQPIMAYRVVCTRENGGGRPLGGLEAPLVGREAELELLENTFARTVRDRRASLFTLYGEPGVGKSRLAREFCEGLEGATVLKGRCLPYGEGVTYWPLAEMVKASAGISDDDAPDVAQKKLRECCEDEAVADLLALAAGVLEALEGERGPQEIQWAARAWAEQLAQAQPLVLVFEDVHWGEEPLLELIEYLAAWVREAPLMLLCLARPELLDVRRSWGGGRVRAISIELEPLPAEESEQLVDLLASQLELPEDVYEVVLEKTEGNPLFVEETMRMLAERDGGRDGVRERIPDTLQALIAARIDRLPPEQRLVLQRASVVGRIFWHGAIRHLSPDLDGDIELALDELLLRDFVVRETRSSLSTEQAFKFKHVLIREVAYGGLAKSARAEYHAKFAEWLRERAPEELLEIRAFHLDRAAALLTELDGAPPAELAAQAAATLTKAARRAMSREAYRTARKLALRAVELEPNLDRRYIAARAAWRLGELAAVAVEMESLRQDAARERDAFLEGRALTALAEVALHQNADAFTARVLVEQALEVLEGEAPYARFDALSTRALVASWLGDADDFERHAKEALAVARDAGRKDLEALVTQRLAQSYLMQLELDEAEPLVERSLQLADESGSVFGRAMAAGSHAWLLQERGRLEESAAVGTGALELFRELGFTNWEATAMYNLARVLWPLGERQRAEKLLRDSVRMLKGAGDRAHLCEAQRSLAQLLVEKGELMEAERLALEARESVGAEDRLSVSTTKLALGVVRAAQGRDVDAEELLREAVAGLRTFDMRAAEREALEVLAQFLRERGRDAEAVPVEERLAELEPESSTARIA